MTHMARLANVLAVYQRAPERRARLLEALRADFSEVRALENGWLLAERPLAHSAPSASSEPDVSAWEGERALLAHGVRTRPIAELLDLLPAVPGEVGFVRLEPGGRFLAVRSAGGLVPVYIAVDDDATLIATSLEDLVRHRKREPDPDSLVQALWAEGHATFPENRTFFRGVQIVPRGHAAVGTPEGLSYRAYWDPRPETLRVPDEETIHAHRDELRETLLDALAGSLSRDALNLLTLSGGVDSSSLAFLANHLGFPIATLTFVAPERSPARGVQLSYVRGILTELGIERARFIDGDDDVLSEIFRRDLPALFFCPHPALRLLPELAADPAPRVIFSGHFADEATGYSQRLQDWIRHTSVRRLLDPRYPRPAGWRDLGRWVKRRALERLGRPLLPFPREVGPWFHSSIRAEAQEWARRERNAAMLDPKPLRELSAWCRMDGWIAMHWECCSRWGIRPSNPFFSRRMLELAFRCHPSELFGPGTKKIMREALADLVPKRYLERPDKGHWNIERGQPLHRPPATGLPDEVRAFLSNEYGAHAGPPTALEDRALNQLMLFSRKVREVRHAAYGRH